MMIPLDITVTAEQLEKMNSIHTAVGATLSAAILAGAIVLFVKIYDHYNNKSLRDIKDVLDIAKESDRLPESGKVAIESLVMLRSEKLVTKSNREQQYSEQDEKFRNAYGAYQTYGILTIFTATVIAVIGVLLAAIKVIGEPWCFLLWALVLGAITAICSCRIDCLDRKMRETQESSPVNSSTGKVPGIMNCIKSTSAIVLDSPRNRIQRLFTKN